MKILAIETSCDETAISLLRASGGIPSARLGRVSFPKFKILESLVASQISVHRPFGGVVPGLAKREHEKNLPILLKKIHDLGFTINDLDLIAITVGPGLEPALWTGIEFAKEIYQRLTTNDLRRKKKRELTINKRRQKVKIIGVNHLLGHLYSFLLPQTGSKKAKAESESRKSEIFPAVALIVSGGHTMLLKMESLTKYKKLGETRDDAAGEAFDKVARLLDLPYPGGPEIERIAKQGDPRAVEFPRPMIYQKNFDFSFSGLKTAVFYFLKDQRLTTDNLQQEEMADVAASFQRAVFDVLIRKSLRAIRETGARSFILTGGVAANRSLREEFAKALRDPNLQMHPNLRTKCEEKSIRIHSGHSDTFVGSDRVRFIVPEFEFSTDNASMIGAAGYIQYLTKKRGLPLAANGAMEI